MKKINLLFSLLIICIITNSCFGGNDSLRIVQWLDSITLQPDKQNYYNNKVQLLINQNENQVDKFATLTILKAKFELKRGNFNEVDRSLNKVLKRENLSKRSKAITLQLRGSLKAVRKEFQEAIKDYELALRLFDELGNAREAAYLKNNIANIFFNLNDFESAYSYAKESFDVTYALNDTVYYPQISAILAISEAKLNKLVDAESHALLAIGKGKLYGVPLAIIIGEYAMGDVYSQQKKWNEAVARYAKTVELSEQFRLVQYEIFGRIGLLTSYVALREYKAAIEQGRIVTKLCEQANLHYTDYTVYQQLSVAYNKIGQHQEAYEALAIANSLYRDYSSLENKKAIQELLTIYQTEKKEKELSQKELQLAMATNWILILLLALVIIVVSIIWFRKRNLRRIAEMKLINERKQIDAFVEGEQIERERIAGDIHDGVASTLTGLALQLQQIKSMDEVRELGQHLQHVRNEVRTISKNLLPFNLQQEGWNTAFNRYASSIQSSEFQIFFQPFYDEEQLNNQRGMVVYRIIQELIQNTMKHANATECELFISEENNYLIIQYSDNGIGTTCAVLEHGNGWQSIKKRVEAIEGEITLPTNPIGGFKVDIMLNKLHVI